MTATAHSRADQARLVAADITALAKLINRDPETWEGNCHSISLALVKTGEFGPDARVARGFAAGVCGQHSWIVLGDPYAWDTVIVDATHPAHHEPGHHEIVVREQANGRAYVPQGWGVLPEEVRENLRDIMPAFTGPEVELTPTSELSIDAMLFLGGLGRMDFRRWCWLASNMPMQGWPSKEIIEAIMDSGLSVCVPKDIQGMATDRNPQGLYMQEKEDAHEAG